MLCFAYNSKRKIKRLLKVCKQGFFSISKVNIFPFTFQFLKRFKRWMFLDVCQDFLKSRRSPSQQALNSLEIDSSEAAAVADVSLLSLSFSAISVSSWQSYKPNLLSLVIHMEQKHTQGMKRNRWG